MEEISLVINLAIPFETNGEILQWLMSTLPTMDNTLINPTVTLIQYMEEVIISMVPPQFRQDHLRHHLIVKQKYLHLELRSGSNLTLWL